MKLRYMAAVLLVWLGAAAPATAASVKGTVKNGTTGKPAAGDEVVLFSVAERSAAEVGRGKTDAAGRFAITVSGKAAPTMARVAHQGVGYQAMTPPDPGTVDVTVYDVARTLDAMTATWDVRLQADGDSLKVIDEIAVRNASDPPRVLLNARPFAIELPPDAEILAGAVQTAGRQAIKVKPSAGDRKGEYYFSSPLLPGETRFALAWQLPYHGEAVVQPRISYPLTRLVVVIPDTMRFEPESQGLFEASADEAWAIVKETASPKAGQSASFRVSGTGSLAAVRGPKPRQVGQTAPSHGSQTAPSHGGAAESAGLAIAPRRNHRFLVGGLVAFLLGGSAVLVAYRRRQLRHLSA